MISGYWQIGMDKKDVDETTFVTHHGLYCYIIMPLGLKKNPEPFKRGIKIIFLFVNCQCALVYIEDTIIISGSVQKHLKHTEDALNVLEGADVTIKRKQRYFLCETMEHIGHVIALCKLQVA